MNQQKFKLDSPTLTFLANSDVPRTPVMVPAQSPITLIAGDMQSDRTVDVQWDGKMLKILAADLRTRGRSIR